MAPLVLIAMGDTGVFASLDFKGNIVRQVQKVLHSKIKQSKLYAGVDAKKTKRLW